MGYRGEIASDESRWDDGYDLSEELGIARRLLQRSLELAEKAENPDIRLISALLDQAERVAKLVKLNVDARTKVAMTENDLKLMQKRIVDAMIECVPADRHAQFMGMITGRGTDGIFKRIALRGHVDIGVPEEIREDKDSGVTEEEGNDPIPRGGAKRGRRQRISRV